MHKFPRNDKDKNLIWEAFLNEAQPGPSNPGGPVGGPPKEDPYAVHGDPYATPPKPGGSVGVPSGESPTPGDPGADDPAHKLGMGAQGTPQSGALQFSGEEEWQAALDDIESQHGSILGGHPMVNRGPSNRQAYAQMIADHPNVHTTPENRNQAITDIHNWLTTNRSDIPESTQPSIDSEIMSEDAKNWSLLQDEEDPDLLQPEEIVQDEDGHLYSVINHNVDTDEVELRGHDNPQWSGVMNRRTLSRVDDQGGIYPQGPDPDHPHSGAGDPWDPQGTSY